MPLDICDQGEWPKALTAFSNRSKNRLDMLVNNAGIVTLGPFMTTPLETHLNIINVNIMGTIISTHFCLPMLDQTPAAKIINISSIAALSGWPHSSMYSASKSAICSLSESLSAELAKSDIAVSDIVPGFIDTNLLGSDNEVDVVRKSLTSVGLSWSRPEQVAEAVLAATKNYKLHRMIGIQAWLYSITARISPTLARIASSKVGRRVAKRSAKPGSLKSRAGHL